MKFLCDQCKAKYQIADEKVQGKTLRMKCRKCGHVIEIRAIPGENRPSTVPPAGALQATANPTMQLDSLSDDAAAAVLANPSIPTAPKAPTGMGAKPAAPRPAAGAPQKPAAPPRPGGAGATQNRPAAAPRPAQRTEMNVASAAPNSALSSAFSKSMGGAPAKAAEIPTSNAPTDPPAEEWYVAIDEVPVGPIRHTDLRMKYGQGAVTDDSLVWREGFEEWRPLRTLPELHMLVREEVSQPRGSLLPGAPKPQGRIPTQSGATRGAVTPRPSAVSQPGMGGGRSNVIPFQRQTTGAAARKIDEHMEDDEVTRIAPSPIFPPQESPAPRAAEPHVVDDPFASKPAATNAAFGGTPAMVPPSPAPGTPMFPGGAAEGHLQAPREPSVVERLSMLSMRAKGASKGTVALVGAACLLLGVLIAVVVVRRIVVVEEKVVEKQVQVPVSSSATSTGTAAPTGSVVDVAPSTSSSGPKIAKIGTGGGTASTGNAAAPSTSSTGKKWGTSIDEGPAIPTDGTNVNTGGNEGALDGKLVGEVAQRNAVGVRKVCYEKLVESGPADAKINVHIRPDGGVSAVDLMSGSPPAFAACVQKLAYNWHFPTSGSGGTFPIPYIFK